VNTSVNTPVTSLNTLPGPVNTPATTLNTLPGSVNTPVNTLTGSVNTPVNTLPGSVNTPVNTLTGPVNTLSPLNVETRTQRFKNRMTARKEHKSKFAESPKRNLTPEQIHLAEKLKSARDALREVGKPGRDYLQKEEALLIAYINFKLSLNK
jgi:hypothetical protein